MAVMKTQSFTSNLCIVIIEARSSTNSLIMEVWSFCKMNTVKVKQTQIDK